MATSNETLQLLVKALEAGSYNAAPSSLTQGSSLQVEDLSTVMTNVTFGEKHIKLQKMVKSTPCKSTLAQFDRQLSYGQFGGSAQLEGAVGVENTSDFVRAVVPMCFYSHVRRVTMASNMVDTVDGKKAEDRAAEDAAKLILGDIELDLFRGKGCYTNAGVFDANPLAIPQTLPGILGLEAQVMQSDYQTNTQDLMFAEYGSDQSVVLNEGGVLTQEMVEEASVRSAMNHGDADKLVVDPLVLSAYNMTTYKNMQRIHLAGSPQEATGADLRRQWVSGGTVSVEGSRFLSGKTAPGRARPGAASAPTFTVAVGGSVVGTPFKNAEKYTYFVTSINERGEGGRSVAAAVTLGGSDAGKPIVLTITRPADNSARGFYVYRSKAGGSVCKFIGAVTFSGADTTTFTDLGNRIPGYVTGFLVQGDTMEMKELASYSRAKLAQTDLTIPEVHYRFTTLCVTEPRKNVILANLTHEYTKPIA